MSRDRIVVASRPGWALLWLALIGAFCFGVLARPLIRRAMGPRHSTMATERDSLSMRMLERGVVSLLAREGAVARRRRDSLLWGPRAELRQALGAVLGHVSSCDVAAAGLPQVIQRAASAVPRRPVSGDVQLCEDAVRMQVVVSFPPGSPKGLAIVLHGTGARAMDLFEPSSADDYHGRIGARLVNAGFVVVAPQLITSWDRDSVNVTRRQLNIRALPLGLTLLGVEVGWTRALARAALRIDAFNRLPLIVAGVSMGGGIALNTCALDAELVDACVVSGYVTDRAAKLTSSDVREDPYWLYADGSVNAPPGLLTSIDDRALVRLVAPRFLLIESGVKDPRTAGLLRIEPSLRAIYRAEAQEDRLVLEIGGDGHRFYGDSLSRFLSTFLATRDLGSHSMRAP